MGTAHLQRHFLKLPGVLFEGVRHPGEGDPGDGIAGPCGQMAQLAGAFSPSLCPVERIRHAPKTGVQLRMFPLRARREGPPEIRDFGPLLWEWRPRQDSNL